MNIDATLESMSVEEKLVLMERLWDDLSKRPSEIPSPAWHEEVLAQRLAEVEAGRVRFIDWEDAKRRLRERFQ